MTEASSVWEPPNPATEPLLLWPDGHGLLYQGEARLHAVARLRYLGLVARHAEAAGGQTAQLEEWIENRVQLLGHRDRMVLSRYRPTRVRQPLPMEPAPVQPLSCWTACGAVLVSVGAYDPLPDIPAVRNIRRTCASCSSRRSSACPPRTAG
ncbi:hypothetical protein [Streptomyces sp. NPDC002054]|uniref:hypothetical protein n=1 Tax=Streptomyces sp. NPDC002054 TaxID=3154663 RepID=UPI0033173064